MLKFELFAKRFHYVVSYIGQVAARFQQDTSVHHVHHIFIIGFKYTLGADLVNDNILKLNLNLILLRNIEKI